MPQFSPEWLMLFYIANQVFSALVQSLPPLTTNSGPTYTFINKFLSLLIADFKTFAAKVPPPMITTTTGSVVKTDSVKEVSTPVVNNTGSIL